MYGLMFSELFTSAKYNCSS